MSDLENINYIWATAIEEWIAQGRSDEQIHAVRNFFSGKGAKAMQATSDLIAQEANKAQLQLVSELEKQGSSQHSPTPTAQEHEADNSSLEAMIRWNAKNAYGSEKAEDALDILEDALDMLKDFLPPTKLDQSLTRRTDMIATSSSQDTVIPSRPGEHKKQELERLQ